MHPFPGGEGAEVVPNRGVEGALLVAQELPAGGAARDAGQGLAGEVVVVQVLVGDRGQCAQPVGAEKPALLEAEPFRVGQQLVQQVRRTVPEAVQPAEMVQPRIIDPQRRQIPAQRRRTPAGQRHRRIADPHHAVTEPIPHRLRDEAGGVGEVDRPGPWRPAGDRGGEPVGHGHRPQPVGEAARAGRLLAEHPQPEGDPLVRDPAGQSPDPDRGEHHVRAIEPGFSLGRADGRAR